MTYSMTCSCGDVLSVEAESRDDALAKMKEMMNAEALAAHFGEKHVGQPVPSVDESNAMIDEMLQEATA